LVEETPNHNYDLKTIYNAEAAEDNRLLQEESKQSGTDQACLSELSTPITNVELSVNIKDIQFPELGEHYAMLSCERIGLEVPVYWGDTQKILSAGVGHFMGSFLPGFERSILLSAHNNSYFKPLETIQVGDIITYDTNYGVFQYLIDEVSIINATEAERMLDGMLNYKDEKLIMYTCYPFNPFVSNKEKRLFVYGNKLSGPNVEK
jgi:sortase A